MTPTPEQVIQILSRTRRPRNQAPIIFQAINNDKTGTRPVVSCAVAAHRNKDGGCYGCQ